MIDHDVRPPILLVLAGGFGTRLRSVVSDVPKPLAPVAGRPFLGHLIDSWQSQGITRMIFLLHHQAGLIEDFLESERKRDSHSKLEIRLLTESAPLGTGGAVAYAVREFALQETFLVANADTWMESGIRQILTAAAPAMAVVRIDEPGRYGSVQLAQGKIVSFAEKKPGAVAEHWINSGLYHLTPALFHDWDGHSFSLEKKVFPVLAQNGDLHAVALDGDFIDIGIPDDYRRFCHWIESEKLVKL